MDAAKTVHHVAQHAPMHTWKPAFIAMHVHSGRPCSSQRRSASVGLALSTLVLLGAGFAARQRHAFRLVLAGVLQCAVPLETAVFGTQMLRVSKPKHAPMQGRIRGEDHMQTQ